MLSRNGVFRKSIDNSNQKQFQGVPRHCEERSDVAIFMTVWLHPFSTKYVICGNGVPRASEILGFVQNPVTKYVISTILVLRAMT